MLKSFVSAGHHDNDPGAVSGELQESELTIEFRDLVISELQKLGVVYSKDKDNETLGQYLHRIKPGAGSVTVEFHFDSSSNKKATGTTAVVSNTASTNTRKFAKELVDTTARVLNIKNRGVIPESKTYRKKLAIMRKAGIVALLEIGFISNDNDVSAYQSGKQELAKEIALIIKKYDDLI
ncbi:MAG: N-acetylmuramoyl-L-alanine amidase [Paludibacteraceae bacterium]